MRERTLRFNGSEFSSQAPSQLTLNQQPIEIDFNPPERTVFEERNSTVLIDGVAVSMTALQEPMKRVRREIVTPVTSNLF